MNNITLNSSGISDVTLIENTFIDKHMPTANGEYVKIYIYLLRCCQRRQEDITIPSIADHLNNTEGDITRALQYWEKLNLITIRRGPNQEILSLNLLNIESSSMGMDLEDPSPTENIVNMPDINEENPSSLNLADSSKNEVKPKPNYSPEEIEVLQNKEEIQWTMSIVEVYMKRPLKPMEVQLILYLYEGLNFSTELVMYLYEYCVENGKKNSSYIEKVALNWHEENIDTEEKAKLFTDGYNEIFNTVSRAFGLDRKPGEIERKYMAKWSNSLGFGSTIIKEACDRTILRTQKADFTYANRILETWSKKGVQSLEDIKRLDEEFTKGKKAKHAKNNIAPISSNPNNKFNQFPQRSYTDEHYSDLEQRLLNEGL